MNEKYVWELWSKCKHPHPKYGGGDMIFPMEFAELIVKECIGAISEVKESFFEFRLETDDFTEKNRFFAGEDACNQSVRKIETLFGVEE